MADGARGDCPLLAHTRGFATRVLLCVICPHLSRTRSAFRRGEVRKCRARYRRQWWQPNNLYSPHTTCLRQLGHCFAISTALCSLLIGLGYNAFVVSGYATEDVTMKIMTRVDSPFPEHTETTEETKDSEATSKYALRPPKDLRSKFLLAMEQREIDKANAEKEKQLQERKMQMEEEEKPPFDDLYGLRVHAWCLLLPGGREIEETVFIEPSTGTSHPLNSPLYCGIESVWNHENYWVNMQNCSEDLGHLDYDFTKVSNWEHFLLGEPLHTRQSAIEEEEYDEDTPVVNVLDEKHLDMPISWGLRISVPHNVLKKKFPNGSRTTYYKRTLVEEYAPYIQHDGLVTRISRFEDLECMGMPYMIEEYYQFRPDCLEKIVQETAKNSITEYFRPGREDAAKSHMYYLDRDLLESDRVIEFYAHARHDGLARLDLSAVHMFENYEEREDFFKSVETEYAERGKPPPGMIEGNRRIVVRITQTYHRNESKPANKDVAVREFAVIDREIHLKYHYGTGKVTASTRDFIKPSLAEMGDSMKFNPELTYGYEAEVGAKPPRQLQLFLHFEKELVDEEKAMAHVRQMEDEIAEFLRIRHVERAFVALEVSLFNMEQNQECLVGMQERERQMKEHRAKEVEEDIDYLAPYMARYGLPDKEVLTPFQAKFAPEQCLQDFAQMLVDRANTIQSQFEKNSIKLQDKQIWYVTAQDSLKPEEEEAYFGEINQLNFLLHTLELRLGRHRDLSPYRYEALKNYLMMDPRLEYWDICRE